MPEWIIDLALGLLCGRVGSFPGWKLMYAAVWSVAEREGWSESMPRHLPWFSHVAWPSTLLGGGLALWTKVPWWSLLCGLLVGSTLAGLVWARHLISPQRPEDDTPLKADP